MNINLMIYGSLILEVLGLIIGLWVTIKALVNFHYSKKYYKEYSTETEGYIGRYPISNTYLKELKANII